VKSRVLTDDAPAFSLLETMLWTQEEGYFLRRRHIERLIDSAEYFGFPLTSKKIEETLDSLARGFHVPHRVRLLVDSTGSVSAEARPFARENKLLHAQWAHEPVDRIMLFSSIKRHIARYMKKPERTIPVRRRPAL